MAAPSTISIVPATVDRCNDKGIEMSLQATTKAAEAVDEAVSNVRERV